MEVIELSNIIEIHGKAVYSFCYQITRDKHHADELYQETFLRATQLCYKINQSQNPKGFLLAIAARTWKNQKRKYSWRCRIAAMEEFQEEYNHPELKSSQKDTPEQIALNNELCLVVNQAASSLKDKLKIPLYMYYTAGLSVEEIANALKIPVGTVKSRLYNARKMIKEYMEVNGYERF